MPTSPLPNVLGSDISGAIVFVISAVTVVGGLFRIYKDVKEGLANSQGKSSVSPSLVLLVVAGAGLAFYQVGTTFSALEKKNQAQAAEITQQAIEITQLGNAYVSLSNQVVTLDQERGKAEYSGNFRPESINRTTINPMPIASIVPLATFGEKYDGVTPTSSATVNILPSSPFVEAAILGIATNISEIHNKIAGLSEETRYDTAVLKSTVQGVQSLSQIVGTNVQEIQATRAGLAELAKKQQSSEQWSDSATKDMQGLRKDLTELAEQYDPSPNEIFLLPGDGKTIQDGISVESQFDGSLRVTRNNIDVPSTDRDKFIVDMNGRFLIVRSEKQSNRKGTLVHITVSREPSGNTHR